MGHKRVIDAVLAGNQLEVQSDWELGIMQLKERIHAWCQKALVQLISRVTNDALLQEALVIIEITERLDYMATDVFGFDTDASPVWQDLYREEGVTFNRMINLLYRNYPVNEFDMLVQQHFEKIGFNPREK